ncbi:glutamate-ammonia-ligase adenylyltransferase [Povalibacter uvarum]|uniref:Bifunctional glutamine synthetase adenylyltransferase/adenylyl-removing enzyme n=1 Tax=Povalibacter uvarum TaxID=732238 RepID=A0A841HS58_9GAMM|nr:bifunctional [glutamate--ammonia ligase]-adenylyl-L-tyrosine phosphorylase/[glutamate--ammonia-ligase] adenylyltransferase [Povalibacter uvarum]MBB6095726.1 glutamate-ammonia-ligase adenylyltransferase [Povalibacter uvarum]
MTADATLTSLLDAARARIGESREQSEPVWSQILAHSQVAETAPRVWACSEFIATSCSRNPSLLLALIENGRLLDRATSEWIAQDLVAHERGQSEAELMEALRHFRRRHMVRIAWRDIAGWADLDETLRDLSALADVCIQFAYDRMYAMLTARYGTPRGESSNDPQSMLILGMGKLGAHELNYSSDIDLVFLYPEEGQTDGARSVDNAEFFLRLGQKVTQLLSTQTVDGFVYRVDLRLRPFGDSGRVAMGFGAFEDYLQQHGRDWERYAYVKARAITAQEHFASLYDEVLRPFVFRRYLDFSVFESLRDMKAMIAREVERRELRDNIKLGPGGIREIEFIVQAFQLIRGGNDRRLQNRELRTVLPLLANQRLLGREIVSDLDAAYRFLRLAENRLQEWNDEQTHRLPTDDTAQTRFALSLGMADWSSAATKLTMHRERVARYFAQTVFGPAGSATDQPAPVAGFDLDAPAEDRERALNDFGLGNSPALAQALDQLRTSAYYRRLDDTGRRRLRAALSPVLQSIAKVEAPEVTFARIARILEMIGGRTVYLALLNENATALQRLVQLCSQSQFLADQIAAHPLLLDELIDERLIGEPPSRAQFAEDLEARRGALHGEDAERQVELLRNFQSAAIFRVAVADLTGHLPLMKVSDRLTDIAELIVEEALGLAWTQMTGKHGLPMCGDRPEELRPSSMIVVAYGKFGGLELGYSSDLDLVFLHDSVGEVQRTDGAQTLDNSVFFQRLAQRLVHLLTVHTAAGRLYEVDTRLRPGGNRGLLAQTLRSFREYEFQEAWTWEHQSLLRARAVAGNAGLRDAFEEARLEVLRNAVRRTDLRDEVRKMRARMRENLSKAGPGQVDLKQDAGGVADLEFLVQYWMLKWADRYPEIVIFSDNIRQLESLASGNLVPQSRVDFLVNTYRRYRERLHHLSLNGAKNVIADNEFVEERRGVVEIWAEVMGENL